MASFLDVCRFNPTAGGTTDWTYSSAVVGYQSPTAAGVVNGTVYRYRAESSDLTQWEVGYGAYNTGTGVLARTTVLFNSAGTTAKINFANAPQVAVVALAEDIANLGTANSFIDTTASTSAGTGSMVLNGGLGVAGRISAGLQFTSVMNLIVAPGLDFSPAGAQVVVGSGTYTIIGGSSGLLLVSDNSFNASTAIFLLGGATAVLLGQSLGTTWVVSAAPGLTQWGVSWNGTNYIIKNGSASSANFFGTLIQVRNAV